MLSPGAISGIIIGSIAGLIILIIIPTWLFLRHRKGASNQTAHAVYGSASSGLNPATAHALPIPANPQPNYGPPSAGTSRPTPHGGGYIPSPPTYPLQQLGIHGGGGSFDPNAPYAQPQSPQQQGAFQQAPISLEGSLPSRMELGDELVSYGSMSVKGIRDVGGDQEEDAFEGRRWNS